METIFIFLAGWLSTLSGVALGGWLVFRTKRDTFEPLFRTGADKGDSFNIDDDFNIVEEAPAVLHPGTEKANENFIKQFSEKLAKG